MSQHPAKQQPAKQHSAKDRLAAIFDSVWAPCLVLVLVYPLLVPLENLLFRLTEISLGTQLTYIFIYAILALGLNVVVGYTGLLHLGIAAFFGIGAYITGILTVAAYPFQVGFWPALLLSTAGAALWGLFLGAPTLRLRGDYLAIVTLGFGEVVRFTLRNLEEITAGTRGLNPIPPPALPGPLAGAVPGAGHHARLRARLPALLLPDARHPAGRDRGGAQPGDDRGSAAPGWPCAKTSWPPPAWASASCGSSCRRLPWARPWPAWPARSTPPRWAARPVPTPSTSPVRSSCLAAIILGGLGSLRGTLLGVFSAHRVRQCDHAAGRWAAAKG